MTDQTPQPLSDDEMDELRAIVEISGSATHLRYHTARGLFATISHLESEIEGLRGELENVRGIMVALDDDTAAAERQNEVLRAEVENIAVVAALNPPEVVPQMVVDACRRALSSPEREKT